MFSAFAVIVFCQFSRLHGTTQDIHNYNITKRRKIPEFSGDSAPDSGQFCPPPNVRQDIAKFPHTPLHIPGPGTPLPAVSPPPPDLRENRTPQSPWFPANATICNSWNCSFQLLNVPLKVRCSCGPECFLPAFAPLPNAHNKTPADRSLPDPDSCSGGCSR